MLLVYHFYFFGLSQLFFYIFYRNTRFVYVFERNIGAFIPVYSFQEISFTYFIKILKNQNIYTHII